jgi:hypothetical protein
MPEGCFDPRTLLGDRLGELDQRREPAAPRPLQPGIAQLMVAELVERLNAAGYPDISAAAHPVFENIDPNGTRLTELAREPG